ncbi:Hypothetical protein SRAE_X000054800 [Strongyloides ratti]|uniref:Uncharacterized protein n=1 Tax=Strongyloides ratti TaxID=34506 RepID=A0A090LNC5_STRRB|nr:Hypothetical protein SRAE_X000054800 [Strongyloides ratti]CEF71221.1 Hypothetical protein SRAE_X000054800 [Strongyloides ratti]
MIFHFINVSFTQYDNTVYGYNYPYSTSSSLDSNGMNLFAGITGDFLSSMTSALISGMGNGVTETFLPGTTNLNNIYPQQFGFNHIFTNSYYPSKLYPYTSNYINNEKNTILKNNGYGNFYGGSLIETPYTLPNIYTINSQYNSPTSFNGINGPKPLGSTYGGFSNAWGRPIIPVISSKDTTAFNGKFLTALISKMKYQKDLQISSTTFLPLLEDQTKKLTKFSTTVSTDVEAIKKNNLKRRKRNIVNKEVRI